MFAVGSDLKSGVHTAARNAVQADAPPSVLHMVRQVQTCRCTVDHLHAFVSALLHHRHRLAVSQQ